jgi:4-amino-4-deoxy-L-arabinose transferase
MFNTYFSGLQFSLLVASLISFLTAIYFVYVKNKISTGVVFLIVSTFFFKLFQIYLDPFLNLWDEQMHALVAKNLSNNFFEPKLYPDPILKYDYTNWVGNYIWLHKQPLYLWQMAISIKLFGATPFAVRFPSVLCFCLAAFGVFRIGKLLTNEKIGFNAALLFSTSYFLGELISGSIPTDQNDVVFISYVTASFWCFFEFIHLPDKKRYWILMAIFSGFAVLTKWLVGLLVYGSFFIYLIFQIKQKDNFISLLKICLYSFLITASIFVPWQIYIFSVFPIEASHELEYNTKHFFEALEGHEGDNYYHFDNMKLIYGYILPFFSVAGLIYLYNFFKIKRNYLLLLAPLAMTYLFFTIAETKMLAFTAVVSFVMFLALGSLIYSSFIFLKIYSRNKKILFSILLFIAVIFNINIENIQLRHTTWKKNLFFYYDRIEQVEWKNFCETLDKQLTKHQYVVYNCPLPLQNIKLMFYSNYIGYCGLPTYADCLATFKKGYKVAIYDDGTLPDSILKNKFYKIVNAPSGKRIKSDTTYLKTSNKEFLFTDWEGKLVATKDISQKQKFIIQQFADGSYMIKNLNGIIASIAFEANGKIYFKKNDHKATERFMMSSINKNNYRLSSEDCILIGLNYKNEVVADNDKWVNPITFVK